MEVGGKALIKVHGHSLVGDTIDGGISTFWKKAGGEDLLVYKEETTDSKEVKKKDELDIHCRCGGFSVSVSRPENGGKFRASW